MPNRVTDGDIQPLIKMQHLYFCTNLIHLKVCRKASICVTSILKKTPNF